MSVPHPYLWWKFKMMKFDDWKQFLDISLDKLCRNTNLHKKFQNLKSNSERIRFASSVRYEFLSEELILQNINYGVPSHTAVVWPIRILATRRIIKRVRQYLK